jgi:hypothetical protein
LLKPTPPLCQRARVNTVNPPILDVAEQVVPYVCGKVATVQLANELVCAECAQRDTDNADADRLVEWGNTVEGWADEMRHRPELAQWLRGYAGEIINAARKLEETTQQ